MRAGCDVKFRDVSERIYIYIYSNDAAKTNEKTLGFIHLVTNRRRSNTKRVRCPGDYNTGKREPRLRTRIFALVRRNNRRMTLFAGTEIRYY